MLGFRPNLVRCSPNFLYVRLFFGALVDGSVDGPSCVGGSVDGHACALVGGSVDGPTCALVDGSVDFF